ncbi:MAG TPA: NDP-sugar synthase [Candidatus Binataceae bacterium]|jgi:NDP-sugar pyrophosphorylase family protein|nr:NDP-sugar synthase [Candidatus Binataceae bacterium]
MKALVLSAGKGERLMPLTATVPKPIVEVGGRPLIHYPLRMLAQAGVCEVAINVHHLAAAVETALGRGDALGLRITYAPETALLGTGGPLVGLRAFFGSETFAVLNCDTIIDLDLRALADFHRERGGLATMVLREPDNPDAYSKIEINSEARIRRMRLLRGHAPADFDDYACALTPDEAARLAAFMYCGVMLCEPAVFELMPATPAPFSLMADLFAPMVAQGLPLFGYLHRGYFRTVDDLASLERLRAEFAASLPRLPFL